MQINSLWWLQQADSPHEHNLSFRDLAGFQHDRPGADSRCRISTRSFNIPATIGKASFFFLHIPIDLRDLEAPCEIEKIVHFWGQ